MKDRPLCIVALVFAWSVVAACATVVFGMWQMEAGIRALAWVMNALADAIDR